MSVQLSSRNGQCGLNSTVHFIDAKPDPPPPSGPTNGITSGLWTGEGVCFFVNAEGTKIVESDECDLGKSFSGDHPGGQVDIDGRFDPDICDANVRCGAAWDIVTETVEQQGSTFNITSVNCVNEVGGSAKIYFNTGRNADVFMYEGQDADGRYCYASGEDRSGIKATPAQ